MLFKGIHRIEKASHICRYDLEYETETHKRKKYEIVSRDRHLHTLEDLQNWHSKTVVIIGISEDNERVLLNHEYRMAIGDWMYNFPSGLIDKGETPTQAAARELHEETGLTLVNRIVRLRSSYNAPGLSNESSTCVLATIAGEIRKSDSDFEEIRAHWYTKQEVKALLKNEKMSARAQLFCFAWAYGDLSIDKLAEESDDYGDGHLR